jgi:CRISPR/Cas system CSM-associated protein Csm3 (group 7 of RAMP superfamily)
MTDLRLHLSGLLKCESPLHVGDGNELACKDRPRGDRERLEKGHYNSVCTDHQPRPYIPASTLRGALRAQLMAEDADLVLCLFGHQERAGLLRVEDATFNATASKLGDTQLPYWDNQRFTYLKRGVAIEPVTRTADDNLLFMHELVPPGAAFDLELWLEQPAPERVDKLIAILGDWNGQLSRAIGNGRAKGWGRMRCELHLAERLTAADLTEWLHRNDPAPAFQPWPLPASQALTATVQALKLELLPQSPFLVHEAWFAGHETEDSPDLAFMRNAEGQALIPGSSLKGWLRHRAHKIAATIAHQHQGAPADQAWKLVKGFIDDLFGTERRRGRLWLGDALSDKPAQLLELMMTAIDRFTGGGSIGDSRQLRMTREQWAELNLEDDNKRGGALFKVQAAHCERLECWLEWDGRNRQLEPDPAQKGLLLLIARDLLEGELRLGWGQAKGLGEFAVAFELDGNRITAWTDLLAGLRERCGPADPEQWIEALHQRLATEIQPKEDAA